MDDTQTLFKDVALMKIGPAEGHTTKVPDGKSGKVKQVPVFVDAETLNQVLSFAKDAPNGIKVKNTHDGDASDILGKITNPRIDGDTLRGDLTFNPDHPAFKAFSWNMKELPSEFGLSAGFEPSYEIKGNKALARATDLYHFALEDETAATPDGVFKTPVKGKKVDTLRKNMDADENFSKMIADAVSKGCAAQMEPYAKRLDAMEAAYKAMGKQDPDSDPDADADTDGKQVHIHLKAIKSEIETFNKSFEAKKKELADTIENTMATFATQKLGLKLAKAPSADPQPGDPAPQPEKLEVLAAKGRKDGTFKSDSEAIGYFAKNKPELHQDWLNRSQKDTSILRFS